METLSKGKRLEIYEKAFGLYLNKENSGMCNCIDTAAFLKGEITFSFNIFPEFLFLKEKFGKDNPKESPFWWKPSDRAIRKEMFQRLILMAKSLYSIERRNAIYKRALDEFLNHWKRNKTGIGLCTCIDLASPFPFRVEDFPEFYFLKKDSKFYPYWWKRDDKKSRVKALLKIIKETS